MKKILALLLTVSLLFTMVVPVWGAGYRETALAWVMEKYGVPAENVEIFEGGTLQLEKIGESFWFAKYAVYRDGKVAPPETAPPAPETKIAPDNSVSTRPILVDPMPPANDNVIYGGVYIREKTGTILTEKEMEEFFTKDRELAEAEWEQLRREAGKLDVSLYQKLKTLAAGEKVKVILLPVFTSTDTLEQQFNALKEKYPEFTEGMPSLSQIFSGYAVSFPSFAPEPMIDPAVTPEGETGAGSSPGSAVTFPAETRSVKTESSQSEPYPAKDMPALDERPNEEVKDEVEVTDEYWKRFTAFQEELEALRLAGISDSLSAIAGKLNAMGVTYTATPNQLQAEMTAVQVKEIAELAEVEAVYEDGVFMTMDAVYRGGLKEEAAATAAPPSAGDKSAAEKTTSPLWLLLFIPVLLAGFLVLKRTRTQLQK